MLCLRISKYNNASFTLWISLPGGVQVGVQSWAVMYVYVGYRPCLFQVTIVTLNVSKSILNPILNIIWIGGGKHP